MEQEERLAFLGEVRLFSETLDPDELATLAGKAQVVSYPAGATLMEAGDFGTAMYAVVEGRVDVRLADDQGHTREVATLGRAQIVGEMSLMTGARRSATVVALGDVTAMEISKVALEEMLAAAPQLIDRFALVLTERRAELDRIAAELHGDEGGDVAARIRRFFGHVFGG